MSKEIEINDEPGPRAEVDDESSEFTVKDRRHWTGETEGDETGDGQPARPTLLDEFRQRAEDAEGKLQEYVEAYKKFREEQEQSRMRLIRDMDRRIDLRFAGLVGELLESVDNLDLALQHIAGVPEAGPLAEGVSLARDRFLSTLERNGVSQLSPDNETFNPNEMEAMRVDPVDHAELDGAVTEVLRPGYKLGDHLVRAARVAVGKYSGNDD